MIIFPLLERFVNRGCAEHQAAGLGCAVDYRANYVPLFSPVDGVVFLFNESGGGNWIRVTDSDGRRWEMAHLSERYVATGQTVKAGEKIGKTGNTGTITTGPHLHLQVIKNGVRLDPEPLLANAPFPNTMDFNDKLIRNQETGEFALVVRNKKFIIPPEPGTLALLTFLQREDSQVFTREILNVTKAIWNSIPTTKDLSFA